MLYTLLSCEDVVAKLIGAHNIPGTFLESAALFMYIPSGEMGFPFNRTFIL